MHDRCFRPAKPTLGKRVCEPCTRCVCVSLCSYDCCRRPITFEVNLLCKCVRRADASLTDKQVASVNTSATVLCADFSRIAATRIQVSSFAWIYDNFAWYFCAAHFVFVCWLFSYFCTRCVCFFRIFACRSFCCCCVVAVSFDHLLVLPLFPNNFSVHSNFA